MEGSIESLAVGRRGAQAGITEIQEIDSSIKLWQKPIIRPPGGPGVEITLGIKPNVADSVHVAANSLKLL